METRYCSRLLILNERGELLLFKYKDEHNPVAFWATAGGELKGSETYFEAASRELFEETGLRSEVGDLVMEREAVFAVARSVPAIWKEKYYLVHCSSQEKIFAAEWTEEEKSTIQEWKWWSLDAIKQESKSIFKPESLPDLLHSLYTKKI